MNPIALSSAFVKRHFIMRVAVLTVVSMWTMYPAAHGQAVQFDVNYAALRPLEQVNKVFLPALDPVQLQHEDERNFLRGLTALRVARPHEVDITPHNAGSWERLNDQHLIWRLVIECPNGWHTNLGFSRFHMPEGAQLQLSSPDRSQVMRPFTSEDHKPTGDLWTAHIGGRSLVVEVIVPIDRVGELDLHLQWINVGYRRFGPFGDPSKPQGAEDGAEDSLACNIDVLCPQGAAWVNEIPSVCLLSIPGGFVCSGVLMNNTAQDRKPYILTALHCGITSGNASGVVAYFNYQNSFCRTPGSPQSGQPGNGSLAQFSAGAFYRAGLASSDFNLIELMNPPPTSFNVTHSGWDRSGANSGSGAGIHHPQGEEKRISVYSTFTSNTTWPNCGGAGSNHVFVTYLVGQGLTEGGSSGSPIYDAAHRVIGQLHGGTAANCNTNNFDCYGRISASWFGGGTPSTRLVDWLDPLSTGAIAIDTLGVAPINDLCANATLKSDGTFAFSSANAGTDGPNEPFGCSFNGYNHIQNDIWYKYLASCTGTATVTLCGSNFNTKMAVYASCPTASGQTIACNDDFCGTSSQLSFPVVAGNLYRIRIGGFQGQTGNGTCTISCAPTPPQCPADINGDNVVNVSDLLAVINAWGACAGCPADINGDNVVNVSDMLAVINAWGPCQ